MRKQQLLATYGLDTASIPDSADDLGNEEEAQVELCHDVLDHHARHIEGRHFPCERVVVALGGERVLHCALNVFLHSFNRNYP